MTKKQTWMPVTKSLQLVFKLKHELLRIAGDLEKSRAIRHDEDEATLAAMVGFFMLRKGLPQNLWAECRTGSPSSDPQRARVLAAVQARRSAPPRPRCAGLTAWTPAPRTRVPALV